MRGYLIVKPVDFSARTVITSDPNLSLHVVRVPISIAKNLKYPELVAPFNREDITKLVMRGFHARPGVNYIESKYRVFMFWSHNYPRCADNSSLFVNVILLFRSRDAWRLHH